MGKLLIEPYIHLLTPGQKEDLIDEFFENEGYEPDDDYFRDEKWASIYDMAYEYCNGETDSEWDYFKDPYYNEVKQLNTFTQRYTNLQHSYIEQGLIAWEIKLKKLYKRKYHNFDSYCKAELKLSSWQVNRLINASRIALLLIGEKHDYIPTCESQMRILSPYTDDEITYYWAIITEKYKGKEYELTAKQIWLEIKEIRLAEGLEVKESKWANIKVKRELYEKLVHEAMEYNLSLIDYLEFCIGDYDYVGEPPTKNTDVNISEEEFKIRDENLKILAELEKQWVNSS
jgi:hypothetical protein